jgi:CRISPR-associated endonuclease/helicase Cas3
MSMDEASYFQYWGKARKDPQQAGADYHLLPYHCLDVAAVGDVWWDKSSAIRNSLVHSTALNEKQVKAWVLFFIALHDYGKWDIRFQRKAPEAWYTVNPQLASLASSLSYKDIQEYFHGPEGLSLLFDDCEERFAADWLDDNQDWELWLPWMAAVAGHHGVIPPHAGSSTLSFSCREVAVVFKAARLEWLNSLAVLFLEPVGLSLQDNPPQLGVSADKSVVTMLAGFCAVADWLGSSDIFPYDSNPVSSVVELRQWYQARFSYAEKAVEESGVVGQVKSGANIGALLGNYPPKQVQCLVEKLPKQQGLTLIEASTGSGKTEAALAYAWSLLSVGLADSIVFALPTQATANAMLERLEKAAPILFENKSNLVLAHGRAKYQQNFIDLKNASLPKTSQGQEEAWVQCGQWLSQSRKRVFLGQVGVCTVDQVLVSVLPIKHKFVRGFGIGRSVLIVDEVHAYDSYMYGLLGGVLSQQKLAGGSAILLSATLPFHQKQKLALAWGTALTEVNQSYPQITQYMDSKVVSYDLLKQPEQLPPEQTVNIELLEDTNMLPEAALLQRVVSAVEQGAQVCIVCNLVDVAQSLYQKFQELFQQHTLLKIDQVNLFHSRFTFKDRQHKEKAVLDTFGKYPSPENARDRGHLLVATQVVEQSLDVDFDWLITQLCPVDLLFQRMGRLHRHERQRPKAFAKRICTILVPDSLDYQLHALIYGNSRVLWRTHELLKKAFSESGGHICFPKAYRDWIEPVYDEEAWPNEPEAVVTSYQKFTEAAQAAYFCAQSLMKSSMNSLADSDSNVAALTRDGEMGLTVVPFFLDSQGRKATLVGEAFDVQDPSTYFELTNLNSINVPVSWSGKKQSLERLPQMDEYGLIWLKMVKDGDIWHGNHAGYDYLYAPTSGLQRNETTQKDVS